MPQIHVQWVRSSGIGAAIVFFRVSRHAERIILPVILNDVPALLTASTLQPPLSSTYDDERFFEIVQLERHVDKRENVTQRHAATGLIRLEIFDVVVEGRAERLGSKGQLSRIRHQRDEIGDQGEVTSRCRLDFEDSFQSSQRLQVNITPWAA